MIEPPGLTDFYRARLRIAPHIRRTPLAHSPWLSRVSGGDIHLKLESLQITNSFKLRGAFNAVLRLLERGPDDEPSDQSTPAQIVTASAGNHGRALAYVAERLGLALTVYTSKDAPHTKLDAMRSHGADLRAVAADYDDAERLAKAHAADDGSMYLSPYSHPDIIAGAGTIGLEIFEDLSDVEAVLVPVGGAGLVSGVASATKAIGPQVETIGIEAAASPAFNASIAAGRITEVEVGPTIADGLTGNMDPETITFDIVRRVVDRLALVSEQDLAAGIQGLVREEHLIAEGAGIAAVAAVLGGAVDLRGRRAVLVVSGSNIDATRLADLLAAG